MVTPKQAEKVASTLLDEARKALEAKQEKRRAIAAAGRRRRESPLIPAFIAAATVAVSLDYFENMAVCVALGAAIGALFGWAARRSS